MTISLPLQLTAPLLLSTFSSSSLYILSSSSFFPFFSRKKRLLFCLTQSPSCFSDLALPFLLLCPLSGSVSQWDKLLRVPPPPTCLLCLFVFVVFGILHDGDTSLGTAPTGRVVFSFGHLWGSMVPLLVLVTFPLAPPVGHRVHISSELTAGCRKPFTHAHCEVWSSLRFSVLPKDTLIHWLHGSGIELPTLASEPCHMSSPNPPYWTWTWRQLAAPLLCRVPAHKATRPSERSWVVNHKVFISNWLKRNSWENEELNLHQRDNKYDRNIFAENFEVLVWPLC